MWSSSWDYGTYHIGEQWRLRPACASAQSLQSLRCSHTKSLEVDERSDQISDISPHWMVAHARLKNEMAHMSVLFTFSFVYCSRLVLRLGRIWNSIVSALIIVLSYTLKLLNFLYLVSGLTIDAARTLHCNTIKFVRKVNNQLYDFTAALIRL